MKKAPVIVINLKFMRFIFLLCLFIFAVFLSTSFSKKLTVPSLPKAFIKTSLSLCPAFSENENKIHVFSLLTKKEEKPFEKEIAQEKKKEEASLKEDSNILTRTPSSDAEVKINNQTSQSIDPQKYQKEFPAFLKEDFSVLIVHTHTTESYTPSEKYAYIPTDTDRTQDKNFNMVRVGEEIKRILSENNITVYHDTTINDYPSYNGSYNRSARIVSDYIKKDPSIRMVLDIHRDAIESADGEKIKYTSSVNGENAASIMLVVGSNMSGLKHDLWETNLSFASQYQKYALSLYPTLFRPINLRSQRFNQQLAPGAIIVEVGTNGNTLDEALLGGRLFATSLASFIKDTK